MNEAKYIGLDVHQATISVAVRDSDGKLVMEAILETKAETILQFVRGLRGVVVRLAQAPCHASIGLRPAKECSVEGRKQERPHRFAKTCRTVACESSQLRLSRRHRPASSKRTGAQLFDHDQRSHAGDGSSESSIPELGHSLCH